MKQISKKINKRDYLEKMGEELDITIEGIDNYPLDDNPALVVANHSCLMDIFYLAMAVPEDHVSVVSSRVLYKNIPERQRIINKGLNPFPLEPTSGFYSKLSLKTAASILNEGISLSIFPEGAYNDRTTITKARTGMGRILNMAYQQGTVPYYIPVAIDVDSQDPDLNRYKPNNSDTIKVKVLEPIDYTSLLDRFNKAKDFEEKKALLHQLCNLGMENIAEALNVPFVDKYLDIVPKDNIMYPDGSTLSFESAALPENMEMYHQNMMDYTQGLVRSLKRR